MNRIVSNSLEITYVPSTDYQITQLPEEVLVRIFSYLKELDLYALLYVSKGMKIKAILAANQCKLLPIIDFIKLLIQNLGEGVFYKESYGPLPLEVSEKLVEFSQKIKNQQDVPSLKSLKSLKSYEVGVKTDLVDILKTATLNVVLRLQERIQKSKFIEDVFYLARAAQEIDETNSSSFEAPRWECTWVDISQALSQVVDMDIAFIFAKRIRQKDMRNDILRGISEAQARSRDIHGAIKTAMVITGEFEKDRAFRAISKTLARSNEEANKDQAIAFARLIIDDYERDYALRDISAIMAYKGKMEIAIDVALLIDDKSIKREVFKKIFHGLSSTVGDKDAVKRAKALSCEAARSGAIQGIVLELVDGGYHDDAIKVARMIPEEFEKDSVLETIRAEK